MGLKVIWLNQEEAHLFSFETATSDIQKEAHYKRDHSVAQDGFCHELSKTLSNSEKILIVGPGLAKHHLLICLREHYPLIAKKIVGFEDMARPLENEIGTLIKRRDLMR